MRGRMLSLLSLSILLLGLLAALPALAAAPAELSAVLPASLAPLAGLAGTWQGKSADGKVAKVTYEVAGSVVVEKSANVGEPPMITVYHADGDHLMLTHYCSIGNQPRMRAAAKAGAKELDFKYVDGTNMKSTDPHMHRVQFAFKDADHFSETWTLYQNGKEIPVEFSYERVATK